MIKTLSLLLLSFCFFYASSFKFSFTKNDFEERLRTNLRNGVDKIFSEFSSTTPGCSVGAFFNHKGIFYKGYGNRKLNPNTSWNPSTVSDIASTAKQHTALCIAILIEQGKINEEDDIRKYFKTDKLPAQWNPSTAVIRVKHLIHHTSGLVEYLDWLDGDRKAQSIPEKNLTPEQVWQLFRTRAARLRFTPGDREEYCNTNYWIMGELVKVVTGLSLRQFAQQYIFVPLEMKSTYFDDNTQRPTNPNIATGYRKNRQGQFIEHMPPDFLVGDGGLKTTVEDFLNYDNAYFFPDKIPNGKKVMERITKVGTLNSGKKTTYAYGIDVIRDSRTRILIHEHDGEYAGYVAHFARYPEDKFTVVVMCNLNSVEPDTYVYKIRAIFDASKTEPMWEIVYGGLGVGVLVSLFVIFKKMRWLF